MKHELELQVQAYVDGELPPADSRGIETLLSRDHEALKLCELLRNTRAVLAANEPEIKLPESREFHWSQIERRIAAASPANGRTQTEPSRGWLRFLLPFAGATALIALLISLNEPGSASRVRDAWYQEIETPLEDMNAISFHSESAGMTVVWITSE